MIEKEKVQYTDDGLEAIIFTAQGDMRQVRAVAALKAWNSWACSAPYFRGEKGSDCCTELSIARVENIDPAHCWGLGLIESGPSRCGAYLRDGEGLRLKIAPYVLMLLFLDRH